MPTPIVDVAKRLTGLVGLGPGLTVRCSRSLAALPGSSASAAFSACGARWRIVLWDDGA